MKAKDLVKTRHSRACGEVGEEQRGGSTEDFASGIRSSAGTPDACTTTSLELPEELFSVEEALKTLASALKLEIQRKLWPLFLRSALTVSMCESNTLFLVLFVQAARHVFPIRHLKAE